MNFDFTDDQREIRSTARELLASRSTWDRVREHAEAGTQDETLYAELCELGWAGIAVGEEHGGQGLGAVELVILLEALGEACSAVPLRGTTLAALFVEHAGSPGQQAQWLPGLTSGALRGALGPSRDGVAELVPDAVGADVVVLLDDDGGASLVAAADAQVEPVASIDPTRRYARVTAKAGDVDRLAGDTSVALRIAEVAVAAGLVGVSQRAQDMTVAYVKERKQFGVPVGSFQAVAHKAAQMLFDTEGARSATLFGAWAADADPEQLALGAAMAKASASAGARATTAAAIQLHGGIGFTWEADLHWLFKRAQLDAAYLGTPGTHRARISTLSAQRVAAAASAR
jgi:alkylation response protein AidB-like acyl-CoA dehydrogenase